MTKPVLDYVNNKVPDQPAYPYSLISTFVTGYLDSVVTIVTV